MFSIKLINGIIPGFRPRFTSLLSKINFSIQICLNNLLQNIYPIMNSKLFAAM